MSDSVKLAAIKDVLDRAGVSARTAVDVNVNPEPWQQMFAELASGGRAASRAARGVPTGQVVDADWVENELALATAVEKPPAPAASPTAPARPAAATTAPARGKCPPVPRRRRRRG
ncbi:hypothetical protein [Lolliginicoccus levis]|uniref:hypothetical protein n=1 Tax=Lolliginicoccus levis TaxID=2919542 RepID=UPI00241DC479|nr:hypothetical protein [Lolliginicoccus levis]